MKKEHPDWLKTDHVSTYEHLLKHHLGFMLDGRDKNGRRVYLMRGSKYLHVIHDSLIEHFSIPLKGHMNADVLSMAQVAQVDNVWFEMVLEEMETLENGVSVLMDMKGMSWKVLKWFTPYNSMLSSRFANLTPLKHLEFHIVNTSNLVNTLISMTFPFFSQSLKEKMHFHHDNMEQLHQYLGRDILPEEYGGPKGKKHDLEKIYRNLFNASQYYPKEIWFLKDECEKKACLLETKTERRDTQNNVEEIITE